MESWERKMRRAGSSPRKRAIEKLGRYHHSSMSVEAAMELAKHLGLPKRKVPIKMLVHDPNSSHYLTPKTENLDLTDVNAYACKSCGTIFGPMGQWTFNSPIKFCPSCGEENLRGFHVYHEGDSVEGVDGLALSEAIIQHYDLPLAMQPDRGSCHNENLTTLATYFELRHGPDW